MKSLLISCVRNVDHQENERYKKIEEIIGDIKMRCGLCNKECEGFFCSKKCEKEYRDLNHAHVAG